MSAPNGMQFLTKDEAHLVLDFMLAEANLKNSPLAGQTAALVTIDAQMSDFIDDYPGDITMETLLEELEGEIFEGLVLSTGWVTGDPEAVTPIGPSPDMNDPQFAEQFAATQDSLQFLVDSINQDPELGISIDPATIGFDAFAIADALQDMPAELQSQVLEALEPAERNLIRETLIGQASNVLTISPLLRTELNIVADDELLNNLVRGLPQVSAIQQLTLLGILLPEEQERVAEFLNQDENLSLLLGLDREVRAEFDLPINDEGLWDRYRQQLEGKDIGEQLQIAYQLLIGWDEEAERGQLEILAERISETPTEMLGVPIPGVEATFSAYLNAMWRRHHAFVTLKPHVFAAEGQEREDVLEWLEWLQGQTEGEEVNTWDNLFLPELHDLLEDQYWSYHDTVLEGLTNENFNNPDVPDEYHDILSYLRDSDLDLKDISLFLLSVAWEPADYAISGYEVARDVWGSLTGSEKYGIGIGTGITVAGALLPFVGGRVARRLVGVADEVTAFARVSGSMPSGSSNDEVFTSARESREWFRARYPHIENDNLINNIDFTDASRAKIAEGMDQFVALYSGEFAPAGSWITSIRVVPSSATGRRVASARASNIDGHLVVVELELFANFWGLDNRTFPNAMVAITNRRLSFRAVVSHEYGHAVLRWLEDKGLVTELSENMSEFISKYSQDLAIMSPGVANYDAARHAREYFAELFAASQMDSLPERVNPEMVQEFSDMLNSLKQGR